MARAVLLTLSGTERLAYNPLVFVGVAISVLFAIYATRYYAYSMITLRGVGDPEDPPLEQGSFVAVLLPVYNEPSRLVHRLLKASVALEFPGYEVIVADDSNDSETLEALKAWKDHPRVRIVHRDHRDGFKGGALNNALRFADPRWTHFVVFDADYLPGPTILDELLSRFSSDRLAAVQARQHHVLNESESLVARGSSVNYLVWTLDLPARSMMETFLPLGGSAMIIRRGPFEEVGGFSPTIAEDWDLSVKFHLQGYRVLYDDSVRVLAECPSTLREWVRQQMRWSEGTTMLCRKYMGRVLSSPSMGRQAKADMVMDVLTYLMSIPLLAISIIVTAIVLWHPFTGSGLPSYVSLPLLVYLGAIAPYSGVAAFHREGRFRKIFWLPLGLLLTYSVTPFIAYAASRGLLSDGRRWMPTRKPVRSGLSLTVTAPLPSAVSMEKPGEARSR